MDLLNSLWHLVLIVACLLLLVFLITVAGLFLHEAFKAFRGARRFPRPRPPIEPNHEFALPYGDQDPSPRGPRLEELPEDQNPNEFCPQCHYHWTVCANVHGLHGEPVPLAATRKAVSPDAEL